MTTGGVELLERIYEAWNRRDIEAVVALMHPDLVVHLSGDFPGMPDVLHGREGVRRFFELFGEVWETLEVKPERYEDLGDRTVALLRFVGRAHAGMTVEREAAHTVWLEDGLVVRLDAHGSWADALAAGRRDGVDPTA
jgi:ketosteroid isomerase-like protein